MVKRYGTREEVWDGQATKTRGGLTKNDLVLSKTMKIVSKKKSQMAKAAYAKYGFNKRTQEEPEEAPEEPEKPKKKRRRMKKDEPTVEA